MTENNSKILIIGVTGNLGFELANASLIASHQTFGLVRDSAFSDPTKSNKLQSLENAGLTILKGSIEDELSLMEALKKVDVVICAVSSKQVHLQKLLVSAIKKADCIKRFFPSEFGLDPDKTRVSDLDHNFYSRKTEIRRLVEAEGIPYTYVCCNFYMSYLLPSLVQPHLQSPPRDKVTIFGDGEVKGVFVKESDVAAFTISTVDDPRLLNKVLYLMPPRNTLSMNELVDIWEKKIEKSLERIYVSEEKLLQKIHATTAKLRLSISTEAAPNPSCSYDICLECCQELRESLEPGGHQANPVPEHKNDGNISCPHKRHGGSGAENLVLKRILDANCVDELIKSSENLISNFCIPDIDSSRNCSLYTNSSKVRQASRRDYNQDNLLFCPDALDLGHGDFEHFQMHWRRGEPVIVRNATSNGSGLSWEPNVMLRDFRDANQTLEHDTFSVKAVGAECHVKSL